jgi:hypothetical protein
MKTTGRVCVPPSPFVRTIWVNNFSQRYINGYRTGYFLALEQICRR